MQRAKPISESNKQMTITPLRQVAHRISTRHKISNFFLLRNKIIPMLQERQWQQVGNTSKHKSTTKPDFTHANTRETQSKFRLCEFSFAYIFKRKSHLIASRQAVVCKLIHGFHKSEFFQLLEIGKKFQPLQGIIFNSLNEQRLRALEIFTAARHLPWLWWRSGDWSENSEQPRSPVLRWALNCNFRPFYFEISSTEQVMTPPTFDTIQALGMAMVASQRLA